MWWWRTAACVVAAVATAAAAQEAALTLDVAGVGSLTVPAGAEPAASAVRFARRASAAGVAAVRSRRALQEIVDWFCARRACTQALPQTVRVPTDLGEIVVEPWQEPATAVENFAAAALVQAERQLSEAVMTELLARICGATVCFRAKVRVPEPPATLTLEGMGTLTVGALEDPADAVEAFAAAAVKAGLRFGFEEMRQVMENLCQRRTCSRMELTPPPRPAAQQPITLNVDGVGSATVRPDQDPADVVEAFAKAATEAGIGIGGEDMMSMMNYFCTKRPCTRLELQLPAAGGAGGAGAPIVLEVQGVGSATCRPNEEPADVVEAFVKAATEAGVDVADADMVAMLTYFCERRACSRKELRRLPVAAPPSSQV